MDDSVRSPAPALLRQRGRAPSSGRMLALWRVRPCRGSPGAAPPKNGRLIPGAVRPPVLHGGPSASAPRATSCPALCRRPSATRPCASRMPRGGIAGWADGRWQFPAIGRPPARCSPGGSGDMPFAAATSNALGPYDPMGYWLSASFVMTATGGVAGAAATRVRLVSSKSR
jgi:hypothetical protein